MSYNSSPSGQHPLYAGEEDFEGQNTPFSFEIEADINTTISYKLEVLLSALEGILDSKINFGINHLLTDSELQEQAAKQDSLSKTTYKNSIMTLVGLAQVIDLMKNGEKNNYEEDLIEYLTFDIEDKKQFTKDLLNFQQRLKEVITSQTVQNAQNCIINENIS